MKSLKVLVAGFLALGMFACSNNDDLASVVEGNNNGATVGSGEGVYATLTLSLPAKRAQEDFPLTNDGVEFGQDFENKVGSVLIVLAAKDAESGSYTYITSSISDAALQPGDYNAANNPKYTVVFDTDALANYKGQTIYPLAYANPTAALRDYFAGLNAGDSFTDAVAQLEEANSNDGSMYWKSNGFLMTSMGVIDGKKLDEDFDTTTKYSTPETAFNLGTVPVARVVARFDYKAAKAENEYTINGTKLVYKWVIDPGQEDVADEEKTGHYELDNEVELANIATITLTDMALINMSSSFYYLPRTSNDGKNENITLCPGQNGMEANWVVSPQYEAYLNYPNTSGATLPEGYIKFPMNDASKWQWTSIAKLNSDDNDNSWNTPNDNGEYKIWRYALENTIPYSEGYKAQKKGITTGVVFKGKLTVSDDSHLKDAYNAHETIYMFGDVVYGSAAQVAAAVEKSPISNLADAFAMAFEADPNKEGAYKEKDGVNMGECGFTAYRYDESSDSYPMYYYYYNRHNNNDNNQVMGPMEFGVVRNNVYKLAVTNIKRFGHPVDSKDDPDPDEPDDEDEENKVYFTVDVEVLPWVVRVNNIEF